jgi:protocatechuate 3,4-dioxygenase alpha subunit
MTERLGTTPSQTVGPFLSIALHWDDGPDLVAAGTPDAIRIGGQVFDGAGDPIPDALIEIWQADPNGRFDHPADPRGAVRYPGFRSFGRCPTDADGRYGFRTVKPGRVDAEQAPHIDVTVLARGLLKHLVTRIYFPDETVANAADPILRSLDERDRSLVIAVADSDGLRFDIRLQSADGTAHGETPFFTV